MIMIRLMNTCQPEDADQKSSSSQRFRYQIVSLALGTTVDFDAVKGHLVINICHLMVSTLAHHLTAFSSLDLITGTVPKPCAFIRTFAEGPFLV
jgi:hypothetical protein